MDLRSIANSVSTIVNANESVTLRRSNGYTIGAGRRQVPAYEPDIQGFAQIQALDGSELQHLENMSQQGVLRAIYLRGALHAITRPLNIGGDIVKRADGSTWLITKVLETWPDWTKAVITLQVDQ